jgi:CRISPR-associated endonuclease/helicase Cas3
LKDLNDFLGKLDIAQKAYKKIEKVLPYWSKTLFSTLHSSDECFFTMRQSQYAYWNVEEQGFYILNRLLYSLITSTDFYATYEYFTGDEADIGIIDNKNELFSRYTNTDIYKSISRYRKDKTLFLSSPINALRSEIFIEAEENLLKQVDNNIFFLEAPTGSGKTNTSINLALNLIKNSNDLNKIFYIFPFNTLVEQTRASFQGIFKEDDITVINSVTPIVTKEEKNAETDEGYINYENFKENKKHKNQDTTFPDFFYYF